jgi:hypothetical protein
MNVRSLPPRRRDLEGAPTPGKLRPTTICETTLDLKTCGAESYLLTHLANLRCIEILAPDLSVVLAEFKFLNSAKFYE